MTNYLGIQNISAGTDDSKSIGSAGLKGVLIGNESGLSTVILMDGTSYSKSLYPGTVDFFPITGGFTGVVKWKTQALLNNVAQWPSSFLQFDTVGINEDINVSVYPLTLPRLTNVGNNLSVSTINSLVNDGNATGTQFIEVTVSGAPGSSFIFKSDGTITIAELIANVVTPFIQSFPGQTVILKLGELGKTTEVLGALQVDQNGAIRATLNTAISLAMGIAADTNRGLVIFGHSPTQSGNLLALQTSAFANVFTVGPTGDTAIGGALNVGLAPTNVLGTVSGSVDIYYTFKGTEKEIRLNFKAMKTNQVDFALPVAFTAGAQVVIGDGINLQFMSGGIAQATNNMNGFNTFVGATNILAPGIGDVLAGFDTIRFAGTGAAVHSGWATIKGT